MGKTLPGGEGCGEPCAEPEGLRKGAAPLGGERSLDDGGGAGGKAREGATHQLTRGHVCPAQIRTCSPGRGREQRRISEQEKRQNGIGLLGNAGDRVEGALEGRRPGASRKAIRIKCLREKRGEPEQRPSREEGKREESVWPRYSCIHSFSSSFIYFNL